MQHPEYIYWAAVCVIAWPSSLFSKCAGILAGTWAIGQVAYVLGAPEPETQVVLYCIALIVNVLSARTAFCYTVAALYLPLALISACSLADPVAAWWGIFGTAMVQVMLVPFTVNWQEVIEVRQAFKERRSWDKTLYRLRALVSW